MKYPRLPDALDRRRKLMDTDIADIRLAYAEASPFPSKRELMMRRLTGEKVQSESQWIAEVMEMYLVSYATVYYWTHDESRTAQRLKNAKVHSKVDMVDYAKHRALEMKARVARWKRYDPLKEWQYTTSARNEKRASRKTVMGKPIQRKEV